MQCVNPGVWVLIVHCCASRRHPPVYGQTNPANFDSNIRYLLRLWAPEDAQPYYGLPVKYLSIIKDTFATDFISVYDIYAAL